MQLTGQPQPETGRPQSGRHRPHQVDGAEGRVAGVPAGDQEPMALQDEGRVRRQPSQHPRAQGQSQAGAFLAERPEQQPQGQGPDHVEGQRRHR